MLKSASNPTDADGYANPAPVRHRTHAARIRKPEACGCGAPVAFDVERKEFFCVGCGAAKECTCRRSAWTSQIRPVNVA